MTAISGKSFSAQYSMSCFSSSKLPIATLNKRRPKAWEMLGRVSNVTIRHPDVAGREPWQTPRRPGPEVADMGQRIFCAWSRADSQEGRLAYRSWSFFI